MTKRYLLDTNTFITPYKRYYPFDLAPNFWVHLKGKIEDGNIVILDKVYEELVKGDDELKDWVVDLSIHNKVVHKEPIIIAKYGEILTYIQNSGLYKPRALAEWSDIQVADPWLIAAACAHQYTIVTFETPNGNLSKSAPSAHPKIPDVARTFGVECKNLFEIMRELSISL